MPGGELANLCFDCGTCASVCPVSELGTGFDPRKILHMIKLGLKDQLLSSPTIWHCTHCDTCAFVCPQDMRFSLIVDVLREMAISQGYSDVKGIEMWGTAPCKATCPAHISIQGFVGAIVEERYEEGLKLIKEDMPFPGVCGRICPHPCEARCNRGRMDAPIAIESLKRFTADIGLCSGSPDIPKKKGSKRERIAVIGAGPAGLTVGNYLAIEGYPVTIFEKLPVPGGMMAVGIPEFRLPRNILQAEIDLIKCLGIDIRLNFEVGKDVSFAELQEDYEAIFLGTGCHRALRLGLPGESELTGIIDGLTFLRDINLANFRVSKGRLVVVGGGNTAVDCARVAQRLGYKRVCVLYRRTRDEMPANTWEIDDAIEEGIEIQFLTAPVRILAKNGKVCGLECIRMNLGEPDESGRRRPNPVKGSEFKINTDMIVSAIGQAPDLSYLPDRCGIGISKSGLILADSLTAFTHITGIFAGGDVVSGPRTVVEAVAFGKQAAIAIDQYLKGEGIHNRHTGNWKGIEFVPKDFDLREREPMPCIHLKERMRTFKEIELGFSEAQARREAERCFRICGMQKANAF